MRERLWRREAGDWPNGVSGTGAGATPRLTEVRDVFRRLLAGNLDDLAPKRAVHVDGGIGKPKLLYRRPAALRERQRAVAVSRLHGPGAHPRGGRRCEGEEQHAGKCGDA